MHLAHYWWKQRKSNPLCCCWSLSHWLSACSGIDWLWFMISKIFIGSIYSATRVCPCATTLSCAHSEWPQVQAQPRDWKHSRRKGARMFSRLLHGIKREAGKGTSWEQLGLGKEGRWGHSFISPTQCPHLLPSLSQAILRLAFSSLLFDFTQKSQLYPGASWSHGIVSFKCPLLKRPQVPCKPMATEKPPYPQSHLQLLPLLLCLC